MEQDLYRVVDKAKKYDNLLKIQGVFERLQCSFCGKSQDDVDKLIAGKNVYICNNCINLCTKILDDGDDKE